VRIELERGTLAVHRYLGAICRSAAGADEDVERLLEPAVGTAEEEDGRLEEEQATGGELDAIERMKIRVRVSSRRDTP
jgi:hypothetical protein